MCYTIQTNRNVLINQPSVVRNVPSQLLPPQPQYVGDRGRLPDPSSSGWNYPPSGPLWRFASRTSATPEEETIFKTKPVRGAGKTFRNVLKYRKRCSYFVLAQQEGQQHQHPPIMYDPPDVDVALCARLAVAGEQRDVFGHQQGQVGCCGHPHCVWKEERGRC